MSRPLEPGARLSLCLDDEKPEGQRPTVYFRALSAREHRQLLSELDKIVSAANGVAQAELLLATVKPYVLDWANLRLPSGGDSVQFDAEQLDAVLDDTELWQLFTAIRTNGRVSLEDKKKSAS